MSHGQAAELLQAYVGSSSDASQPVVELASPTKLAAAFAAAGVPLKLDDHQSAAASSDELLGRVAINNACTEAANLQLDAHS